MSYSSPSKAYHPPPPYKEEEEEGITIKVSDTASEWHLCAANFVNGDFDDASNGLVGDENIGHGDFIVSVLGREERYTVKYGLSPRDCPRAIPKAQVLLYCISRLES